MKILGIGENKYICEITDEELWHIGFSGDDDSEEIVEAGQEIDLARVIKAATYLRELDQEYLRRVVKELQMALAGVEKVKTTVEALTLFDKLKDEA